MIEPAAPDPDRHAELRSALRQERLPDFVERRLGDARAGRAPWMSTMTPAELLLSRELGIRPIAVVSGACGYRFDRAWGDGHLAGWTTALARMRQEALAAGANAVVDVRLRSLKLPGDESMDFSVVGSAVRLAGMPPSSDPVVATVSAVEFVRLLKEGIVPTGVAIGAKSGWINRQVNRNELAPLPWESQPLNRFGGQWQRTRKRAVQALRENAGQSGDGVLAHTWFEQLLKRDRDKPRAHYLSLFIAIGTVVQCRRGDAVAGAICPAIDLCEQPSPLAAGVVRRHHTYPIDNDHEGAV